MSPRILALPFFVLTFATWAGEAAGDPPAQQNPPPAAPADNPVVKLLDGTASQDAAVAELSVKSLLKELSGPIEKSDKIYLKKIAVGISSEKPEERAAAVTDWKTAYENALKYNKEAMANLLKQLGAADEKTRTDAQVSFVAIMNLVIENKIIGKLIDDLASADQAVSSAAVQKLKDLGEDACFDLVQALEDERMQVRRLSLDILKAAGPKAKSVASDLAFLLDNDDKNVRRSAAAVLENLGPDAADATGDLVTYLSNDEKSVRRLAVNILKKIGPAAAEGTDDLIDLLTDDDKNTRALATEALLAIGEGAKEGVDSLENILKDEEGDDDSKERAIKVLVAIGGASKPALEELKKLATEGKSDTLKTSAKEAAARIEAFPVPPEEKKAPEEKKDGEPVVAPKADAKPEGKKDEPPPAPAPAPEKPADAPKADAPKQ